MQNYFLLLPDICLKSDDHFKARNHVVIHHKIEFEWFDGTIRVYIETLTPGLFN